MRPVDHALITHGHADHARPGHKNVLATAQTLGIMKLRYRDQYAQNAEEIHYGEEIKINDVRVSFHPAGHVLGSAQIKLSYKGSSIVLSGDYKRRKDRTCLPFEPVPCDVFVTEATFGLPVFRHPDTASEIQKLLRSMRAFPERPHLIGCYPLGKTQRVLSEIRAAGYDGVIYHHGALQSMTEYYQSQGVDLGRLEKVDASNRKSFDRSKYDGQIVLCPPSALTEKWARRFNDPLTCMASGWMRIRQRVKQRGVELPLILSDHADWDELQQTIKEVNPEEVWVMHGREDALVHWARDNGYKAQGLSLLGYDDEGEES